MACFLSTKAAWSRTSAFIFQSVTHPGSRGVSPQDRFGFLEGWRIGDSVGCWLVPGKDKALRNYTSDRK